MSKEHPLVTTSAGEQRDLDALANELGLTERHKLFAEYLASGQATSNADAARKAGYPVGRAKQEGWRLAQHSGVKTYLRACLNAALVSMQTRAVQVLGDLLQSDDDRVRKDVAFGILDRVDRIEGRKASTDAIAPPVLVQINMHGTEPPSISRGRGGAKNGELDPIPLPHTQF